MKKLSAIALLLSASAAAQETPHRHDAEAAHPGNPVLQNEHCALLDLVDDPKVTHAAAHDGRWLDPATWNEGRSPGAQANALIPRGRTVTIDGILEPALRTLRVDGTLRFAPDRDSTLRVDTLVVSPGGHLEIGTPGEPIHADKRVKILFADPGPIDPAWDPLLLSRGLISHGTATIHGAEITSFLPLARAPGRGETRLELSRAPAGWTRGDRLILTGTRFSKDGEDEDLEILSIAGPVVTVRPLAFDHRVPDPGLSVYVGNLTRNVVFESENSKDVARFGHIMFMHSQKVDVRYASFVHLGRTDKRKPVNDPKVDKDGTRVEGTGLNARGRYALHFHRTGSSRNAAPALVRGCAVVNGPGWGFLNHSSFVDFEDNVAYDVNGAAFVTEAGDEIGSFRRNLAIRSTGSGEDVDSRRKLQDFGHEGDGFWFQGGGVEVEENVACGQRSAGFIFFTTGLVQDGLGTMSFKSANLQETSWTRGLESVDVEEVPIRSFKKNIAFASDVGFIVRFHLGGSKHGGPSYPGASVLEESSVWNTRQGVSLRYSHKVTLRNLTLLGDPSEKYTQVGAMGQNEGMGGLRFENLRVEGWPVGIDVRESGDHTIQGGIYRNRVNVRVVTAIEQGRDVDLRGEITFAPLGSGGSDIELDPQFGPLLQGSAGYRDPNLLFAPNVVRWKGKQIYFPEQAAGFVPFRKDAEKSSKGLAYAPGSIPDELLGKTNQELWDQYGLAIAGAVCPANAEPAPRIRGLIGSPSSYPRPFHHDARTTQIQGYSVHLGYLEGGRKGSIESEPRDLEKGWNLVTFEVLGQRRSFLVFAGDTIPKPVLKKSP
jgi:hypothetical protein